jgi:AbrB family looped-hinge helix DNA binding protein
MQTVTVSEKGQVVIPASMRRSLGIKPGMELGFELEDSSIRVSLLQPVPTSQIDSGFGLLKAKKTTKPRTLMDFDVAQAMRQGK